MSIILERFENQPRLNDSNPVSLAMANEWVWHHKTISLEYSTLCATIIAQKPCANTVCSPELCEQLHDVIRIGEYLETLYRDYLNVASEGRRLANDRALFQTYLPRSEQPIFSDTIAVTPSRIMTTKTLRLKHVELNWIRLFLLRLRRLCATITLLSISTAAYRGWFALAEQWIGPIFLYLNWLFFIPRLLTNLILFANHLVMPIEQEATLSFKTRIKAQLDRRWFELANDGVWCVAGIYNCFILAGNVTPTGLFVGIALQAYDVFLACILTYLEISRLHAAKKKYDETHPIKTDSDRLYLIQFEKRLSYERKRLGVLVANTLIILLCMILGLPALLDVSAMIPCIAASITLLTTVFFYAGQKYLQNTHRPNDDIHAYAKQNQASHDSSKPSEWMRFWNRGMPRMEGVSPMPSLG